MYTLMKYFFNSKINKKQGSVEEDNSTKLTKEEIITNEKTIFENHDKSFREKSCKTEVCTKVGIITAICDTYGVIDNSILFDFLPGDDFSSSLKLGLRIEYTANYDRFSEFTEVIRINKIIQEGFQTISNVPNKKNFQNRVKLSNNQLENTTHDGLGNIIDRFSDAITIETDLGKKLIVQLEKIVINFVPKEGDRIKIWFNNEADDKPESQENEAMDIVKIKPTELKYDVRCSVVEIHKDWGGLNNDCYFYTDIISSAGSLNIDDVVIVDMIQSAKGDYVWRCVKMLIHDRILPGVAPYVGKKYGKVSEAKDVTVTDNVRCIFDAIFQTQELNLVVTNNSNRDMEVLSIEIFGKRRNAQIRLINPGVGEGFLLPTNTSHTITFLVNSKKYGNSVETFCINFDNFNLKRSVTLIVCENKAVAEQLKVEKDCLVNDFPPPICFRNCNQRSRHYANHIWSKKGAIVPGVSMVSKRRFIGQQIDYYEVPKTLRDTYLTAFKRTDMLESVESLFPALTEKLSFENYTKRFHTLLHLEEIECFINVRQYDKERAHFTRDGNYLSLTIENLAERRPSLVLGDTVRAVNPWAEQDIDKRCYEGIIHKVLFNKLLIKFNSGFQSKYNGEDYRLEFFFSRFGFRKQHFAVSRIVKSLGKKLLFPEKIELREYPQLNIHQRKNTSYMYINKQKRKWYNPDLNDIQKSAVFNILRGEIKSMPYVILGPPGTGKTVTIIETIIQLSKLLPNARILVGTPSNSSADLITSRLIESNVMRSGDFIRLVSYNQIEKDLIPKNIMPYCATVDLAVDGSCNNEMKTTSSGLKMRCQMKFLGRHRITISTCSTLGNFMQMNFPVGHFTHAIIDEAGQCTEPEVMIPICQVSANNGQVILAGDPHQLQAIVVNRYASDRGFSISFLERILQTPPYLRDVLRFPKSCGYNSLVVTKLLYNYRALPSILKVYNELFYNKDLIPIVLEDHSNEAKLLQTITTQNILPQSTIRSKNHGVFFYGMRSLNKQEPDSPSWFNPIEARNIFLMTIQLYRHNISPDNIGIITPYMKQVKHLRKLFIDDDIAMPKIGSVEEFQGQERDIILISTVRSCEKLVSSDLRHNLGFVQSAKRMNVAISRARSLLCIFGNPYLLALDPFWRTLIKYCIDNDAYVGCETPECFRTSSDEDSKDNPLSNFILSL